MARKRVTEEQNNEWIQRYLNGETARDIAKDYPQFHESTVERHIKKAGISRERYSYKTIANKEKVKEDYLNGMYCEDIAKKYDMEVHSIYKILDCYGIKRRNGKKSSCNEDYFETIDTPNKAYLLGFITADGSIIGRYYSSCVIEVKEDDFALLLFARAEICPNATITQAHYGKKKNCRISFSSVKLCNDLKKYGIIPNKSLIIERVPKELIPKDLLRFYFRGLVDGDGCAHKNGHLAIYSGSKKFIESVRDTLVEEIGVTKLEIYHGACFFTQWNTKEDRKKLFQYLYGDRLNDTFYYYRKYLRLRDGLKDDI